MILLAVGLTAIGASLALRNSSWAHERRLKTLNIEDLRLAVHDDPGDPLTHIYYGEALIRAAKAADADAEFTAALGLKPGNERALSGLGVAQIREGKLPEAIETLKKALKLKPDDKPANFGLAQALFSTGSARDAIEPLKRVLSFDPKSAEAWFYLGKMYAETNSLGPAMDAYKNSVKLQPKSAGYWRDMGQLALKMNLFAQAVDALKHAALLVPNDAICQELLGEAYAKMPNTAENRSAAQQSFVSAINIDPKLTAAYIGLGDLMQAESHFPEAEMAFRRACALDPTDDSAVSALGDCMAAEGKKAEGARLKAAAADVAAGKRLMDSLRKKLAADPTSREARLGLARLYRKYHSDAEALKQYAAYQDLGMEDPAVRKEIDAYQEELAKKGVLPGDAEAQPAGPQGP